MTRLVEGPCGSINDSTVTSKFKLGDTEVAVQIIHSTNQHTSEFPIVWLHFFRAKNKTNLFDFEETAHLNLELLYRNFPKTFKEKHPLDALKEDLNLRQIIVKDLLPLLLPSTPIVSGDKNEPRLAKELQALINSCVIEKEKIKVSSDALGKFKSAIQTENALRDEVKFLSAQLKLQSEELAELKAEYELQRSERQLDFNKLENYQSKLARLEIDHDNLISREAKALSELSHSREQMAELSSQIDTLLDLNATSTQSNLTLIEERSSLRVTQETLQEKNSEIEKLKEQIEIIEKERNLHLASFQNKEKNFQNQNLASQNKQIALEENIQILNQQLQEMQLHFEEERDKAVKREVELRNEIRTSEASAQEVRTENMEMAVRIARIVEEVQESRRSMESEREKNSSSLQLLQKQLNESLQSIKLSEDNSLAQKKRMEELVRSNESLVAEHRKLENEIKNQRLIAEEKFAEASKALESAEAEALSKSNLHTQELSKSKEAHQKLLSDFAELRNLAANQTSKLAENEGQIKGLSDSNEKLAQQLKEQDFRYKLELESSEMKTQHVLKEAADKEVSLKQTIKEIENRAESFNRLVMALQKEKYELQTSHAALQKERDLVITKSADLRYKLEKESAEHSEAIHALEKALASETELSRNSIKSLSENLLSAENNINVLERELTNAKNDLNLTISKLNEVQEKERLALEEKVALAAELQKLKESSELSLKQSQEELRKLSDKSAADISGFQSRVTDFTTQLDKARSEIVRERSIAHKYSEQIKTLNLRNAATQSDLEKVNQNFLSEKNKFQQEVTEIQKMLSSESESHQAALQKLSALEKSLVERDTRISDAESELLKVKENLTFEKTQREKLAKDRERLIEEMYENRRTNSAAQQKNNESLQRLQQELNEITKQSEHDLTRLNSEITLAASKLQERDVEIEELKDENAQIRAGNQAAAANIQSLKTELENLKQAHTETLAEQSKNHEAIVSTFTQELLESNQKLASLQSKYTLETDAQAKSISELTVSLNTTKDLHAQAEKEVKDLRANLAKAIEASQFTEENLVLKNLNLMQQIEVINSKTSALNEVARDKAKLIAKMAKLTNDVKRSLTKVRELEEISKKQRAAYEKKISNILHKVELSRTSGAALTKDNVIELSEISEFSDFNEETKQFTDEMQQIVDGIEAEATTSAFQNTSPVVIEKISSEAEFKESLISNKPSAPIEMPKNKAADYEGNSQEPKFDPERVEARIYHLGKMLILSCSPREPQKVSVTFQLSDSPDSARISFFITSHEHSRSYTTNLGKMYKHQADYFMQRYFAEILINPSRLLSRDHILPEEFWRLLNKENVTITEMRNFEYDRSEGHTVLALEKYMHQLERTKEKAAEEVDDNIFRLNSNLVMEANVNEKGKNNSKVVGLPIVEQKKAEPVQEKSKLRLRDRLRSRFTAN